MGVWRTTCSPPARSTIRSSASYRSSSPSRPGSSSSTGSYDVADRSATPPHVVRARLPDELLLGGVTGVMVASRPSTSSGTRISRRALSLHARRRQLLCALRRDLLLVAEIFGWFSTSARQDRLRVDVPGLQPDLHAMFFMGLFGCRAASSPIPNGCAAGSQPRREHRCGVHAGRAIVFIANVVVSARRKVPAGDNRGTDTRLNGRRRRLRRNTTLTRFADPSSGAVERRTSGAPQPP